MTIRKIAIWNAVSSEEQAKRYSLDAQLADCRAFVDSIPERYKELAEIVAEISMADTRSIIEFSDACTIYPDSYGMLNTLIKSQRINVLLCIRRDRLGREESLIMTIEALCRKHRVKIVALRSSIPSSLDPVEDEGSGYAIAVEAVASRIEIQRLQDRRESGMIGRVADEKLFPGQVPWGYSYQFGEDGEIKAITVDSAVCDIVRYIMISLFLERGIGAETISKILNEENILSPDGDPWTRSGVRALIRNAGRYAGWLEYNRNGKLGKQYVRVKGNYEPMITEKELQAILKETDGRQFTIQRRHRLLSGIVICNGCRHTMYYRKRPSRKDRSEFADYLTCVNRDCTEKAEIVESALIKALEDTFLLVSRMTDENLVSLAAQLPADSSLAQSRLDTLLVESENVAEERKRAITAFITLKAITEAEFADQMKRLDSRLASLTSNIEAARKWLAAEQQKNESLDRLKEVRSKAIMAFAERENDVAKVNQWLRLHLRIQVKKGRGKKRRTVISFI